MSRESRIFESLHEVEEKITQVLNEGNISAEQQVSQIRELLHRASQDEVLLDPNFLNKVVLAIPNKVSDQSKTVVLYAGEISAEKLYGDGRRISMGDIAVEAVSGSNEVAAEFTTDAAKLYSSPQFYRSLREAYTVEGEESGMHFYSQSYERLLFGEHGLLREACSNFISHNEFEHALLIVVNPHEKGVLSDEVKAVLHHPTIRTIDGVPKEYFAKLEFPEAMERLRQTALANFCTVTVAIDDTQRVRRRKGSTECSIKWSIRTS